MDSCYCTFSADHRPCTVSHTHAPDLPASLFSSHHSISPPPPPTGSFCHWRLHPVGPFGHSHSAPAPGSCPGGPQSCRGQSQGRPGRPLSPAHLGNMASPSLPSAPPLSWPGGCIIPQHPMQMTSIPTRFPGHPQHVFRACPHTPLKLTLTVSAAIIIKY